ncbi:MAG TPA: neutral zinc metallopeptidase [Candidatus Limnocylindria bacterium]|nr:neutral zinc metallopeptidase [Candidatus Limnocylindria bacterium]
MRAAIAVVLLAAALSACAAAQPARETSTPAATPGLTATPSYTPFPTDDDFARLLREAVGQREEPGGQIDEHWRQVLGEASAVGQPPYEPPAAVVGYRSGELPPTRCAAGTPASFWRENAFYCRAERSILFDESWLRDFQGRHGSFAPVAILAHEWGHHVAELLGVSGFSIQTELQADCLAGLFLANTGPAVPQLEAGSGDELEASLNAFFDVGNADYDSSAWFQAAEHGSREQRMLAFGTGYISSATLEDGTTPLGRGLSWCYGYADFEPADFTEIGPYRLLNLPGRTEEWHDDVYRIAPEERLGYDTSAIDLFWLPAATGADLLGRLPGLTVLGEEISLNENVHDATGAAYFFEQVLEESEESPLRSGIVAVVEPNSVDGALVLVAYRNAAAPTDDTLDGLRIVAESAIAVYQVLNRLCAPGNSGVPNEPGFSTVCMDIQ